MDRKWHWHGAAFDKLRLTQNGVSLTKNSVTLSLSKRDASADAGDPWSVVNIAFT